MDVTHYIFSAIKVVLPVYIVDLPELKNDAWDLPLIHPNYE